MPVPPQKFAGFSGTKIRILPVKGGMRIVCQTICFGVFRRRAGLHGHRGARAWPQPLDDGPDRRAVPAGHGEHQPPRCTLTAAGSLRRRCRAGYGCRAGGRADRQPTAKVERVGLLVPLAQSVGPNLPALYDVLVLAKRAGSADLPLERHPLRHFLAPPHPILAISRMCACQAGLSDRRQTPENAVPGENGYHDKMDRP